MLAPTPPMGWNSWNTFGPDVTSEKVLRAARCLVDAGFADVGYRYVVVDDCWQAAERDSDGLLQANRTTFPEGLATLADQVHALGLKFGTYTCAGTHTCAGLPGSFGHERVDAQTFADWGVDCLKVDYCHVPFGVEAAGLYRKMGHALRSTGRPIVFSACEWGVARPWKWGRSAGCHLWRTTGDIVDAWERIIQIGFDEHGERENFAGPGGWNDPDMLTVGMDGAGHVGQARCTDSEYRVQFALWCLLAAPLMIGASPEALRPEMVDLLSHQRLIAINQDPLGVQARRIRPPIEMWDWSQLPVYAKPLADGSVAVGLFNLTDNESDHRCAVAWSALGLDSSEARRIRDALSGEDLGVASSVFSVKVPRHDVRVLILEPVR